MHIVLARGLDEGSPWSFIDHHGGDQSLDHAKRRAHEYARRHEVVVGVIELAFNTTPGEYFGLPTSRWAVTPYRLEISYTEVEVPA